MTSRDHVTAAQAEQNRALTQADETVGKAVNEAVSEAVATSLRASVAGPATGKADQDEKQSDVSLRQAVTDQIGGVRGMVESSVPVLVFVAVNIVGSLKMALWSAVGVAVVIAAYRMIKRDSARHALTGLFGVAIAAMFAAKTGKAEDFYLPGIIMNFVYGAAFAVSAAIRRPLVGYAWALVAGAQEDWRERPALMRAFLWLSVLWTAVFWLRGGVQLVLYLADMPIGLGVARILGIAPYAAALAFTVWYGRRVVAREEAAGPPVAV